MLGITLWSRFSKYLFECNQDNETQQGSTCFIRVHSSYETKILKRKVFYSCSQFVMVVNLMRVVIFKLVIDSMDKVLVILLPPVQSGLVASSPKALFGR